MVEANDPIHRRAGALEQIGDAAVGVLALTFRVGCELGNDATGGAIAVTIATGDEQQRSSAQHAGKAFGGTVGDGDDFAQGRTWSGASGCGKGGLAAAS
jgi:hypothetical protein